MWPTAPATISWSTASAPYATRLARCATRPSISAPLAFSMAPFHCTSMALASPRGNVRSATIPIIPILRVRFVWLLALSVLLPPFAPSAQLPTTSQGLRA